MTLTVIVDDADPDIAYIMMGGGRGSGAILDPRILGPSYNGTNKSIGGTLHNTSVPENVVVSYNFTGKRKRFS